MRKIIALFIILLVLVIGCTKSTKTTTEKIIDMKESTKEPDLSQDLNVSDSEDLNSSELDNLDLEMDENLFK